MSASIRVVKKGETNRPPPIYGSLADVLTSAEAASQFQWFNLIVVHLRHEHELGVRLHAQLRSVLADAFGAFRDPQADGL